MKINLKNKIVISLFSFLSLFLVSSAKAEDVAFYEETTYGGSGYYVMSSITTNPAEAGIIFEATENNISRFDYLGYRGATMGGSGWFVASVICEVANINSPTCISPEVSTPQVDLGGGANMSTVQMSTAWETPYETTPGHFYKIKVGAVSSYFSFGIKITSTAGTTGYNPYNYQGDSVYTSYPQYNLTAQMYYQPSGSALLDYVQYNYSQGQAQINGAENPVSWWLHYNVCDTGYPPSGGSLKVHVIDDTGVYDIGTQQTIMSATGGPYNCQGDFLYTGLVDTAKYGTSTIKFDLQTLDDTSTVVQEIYSSGFTVTQLPEIINVYGNINYGGSNPLEINVGNSTSTPISFDYNICNVNNWASSTFHFYNETTGGNTSFSLVPTVCSGTGTINYTNQINFNFDYSFNSSIRLVSATSTQIISNTFMTHLFSLVETPIASSTSYYLFGRSPSEMACSSEEWATEDNAFGFNPTVTMCNIKKGGYEVIENISSALTWVFQNSVMKILYLFPLNIPTKILESWSASATATLPTDLQFLDMTETNGSITGTLPAQWAGTSSDVTFTIFSEDMMASGSTKFHDLMATFKKFTVYLQWFIFAFAIIKFGNKNVWEDMTNKLHKDE